MTTNTAKITDAQIRTLRAEAAAAGDLAQVNLCDAALGLAEALMVDEAREACAAVIARAADMQDDGCLCDYETGESIRPATADEAVSSRAAARVDGGAGIIRVDGRRCYVEG